MFDLFTYKKNLFTLVNKYNAVNVNYAKIKNNFVGINHLLNKISEGIDDDYFLLFLHYVFNFQRFLYLKKGRIRRRNHS